MRNKILCVDFEMLCHEKGMLNQSGTIVEVGACILGENGIEDEFTSYIQPICNKPVNSFTQKFIGASKSDIELAPDFSTVMKMLDNWCSPYLQSIKYWAAWGDQDYKKVTESFRLIRMKKSKCFSMPFYDAQVAFERQNYVFYRMGLNAALDYAGVTHTFKTHRALDDAKKLALQIHTTGER